MEQAAAGLFKIVIFLLIGTYSKKSGFLGCTEIDGIKKIVIYLAIPAVLFLSFSRLTFSFSFIPVTVAVFSINLILFVLAFWLYKLGIVKSRVFPLILSTMNFSLVGIPLYEAVFGFENLHHYTMLDVGNELYVWFVFYFLLQWFLKKEKHSFRLERTFLSSPIIWSIISGCVFGILGIDISLSQSYLLKGVYQSIAGLSQLATPLILIFVGANISFAGGYIKKSIQFTLIRLCFAFCIGYSIKFLLIDHFLIPSRESQAAFFLLMSLPAVFAVPVLAAGSLEKEELFLLNNSIVLHSLVTIALFTGYCLFV